jgi:3D (Asp-Asp-Asp) domain-containing protein
MPFRLIAALAAITLTLVMASSATARTMYVTSTAYCLRGTMANGRGVHYGAVAMNILPLGKRIRTNRSPFGRHRRFRVEDRIGWGTQLDFWVPSCGMAYAWGRRTVRVRY